MPKTGILAAKKVRPPSGSQAATALEITVDGEAVALLKGYSADRPSRFGPRGRFTMRVNGAEIELVKGAISIVRCKPDLPGPEPEEPTETLPAPSKAWQ